MGWTETFTVKSVAWIDSLKIRNSLKDYGYVIWSEFYDKDTCELILSSPKYKTRGGYTFSIEIDCDISRSVISFSSWKITPSIALNWIMMEMLDGSVVEYVFECDLKDVGVVKGADITWVKAGSDEEQIIFAHFLGEGESMGGTLEALRDYDKAKEWKKQGFEKIVPYEELKETTVYARKILEMKNIPEAVIVKDYNDISWKDVCPKCKTVRGQCWTFGTAKLEGREGKYHYYHCFCELLKAFMEVKQNES